MSTETAPTARQAPPPRGPKFRAGETTNYAWNGSTLTFGTAGVVPLTDLHLPDQPADFDTTGSVDSQHTHGTGLHDYSVTASFLGSKAPDAATVAAIAVSIGAAGGSGGSPTTKSYAQALITQLTVSGRKDGRIEGSATFVPGASSLTAATCNWSIGDLGFNGSTFSFDNNPFTLIAAAQYSAQAAKVCCSGAEATENVYAPGIPDMTLTITTLGGPQCSAKDKGATAMGWNDGGTLGTTPDGYTAECVSTDPGGDLDGQKTTVHTFRLHRSDAA